MEAALFGKPEAFFARHEGSFRNPAVVKETLAALRDPHCGADRLLKTLEREPAISARILKMANSAFFGAPRSITSLKAAIVRLGNRNIAQLALASTLASAPGKSYLGFWRHSIAVAMLARHMAHFAGSFGRQEEDEFFSMGLLHDLGILVEIASGAFEEVARDVSFRRTSLERSEDEILGFTHSRLGEVAARKWNFPGDLYHAIAHHHHPREAGEFFRKAAIIHLADLICHGFKFTCCEGESDPATDEGCLEDLKLPVEQLVVFGQWLLEQKPEIDAFGQAMTG